MRNPTAATALWRCLYRLLRSLHHILFFLFSSRSRPILLSCFLDCCCTKLRCYDWNSSKSFNFMRCALGRGMFLDYEWRGRALRGNTCDGVWEVWPRMQYGIAKEKPSDVQETFGTSCHLLNFFLQSEASLISRQKQCKQMLCVCSF